MTSSGSSVMVMTTSWADLVVYAIAFLVGLFALMLILRLNRRMGGKIKPALWYFGLGIFANLAAMFYTEVFGHTYTFGTVTFDVHTVFMTIGMIFFVLSAYNFSKLVPRA